MESNQNKNISLLDCQGTCKTPIGCTCARANKKALNTIEQSETPVKQGCGGCSSGGGCGSGGSCCSTGGGCSKPGGCACSSKKTGGGCCAGKNKLEVYDWLADLPQGLNETRMVEVQFKNTRKGYYLNSNEIELYRGDIVAVEATPGHDIGEVTLTGKLVPLQMKKSNYRGDVKRIYRVAKQGDIDKAKEARAKEHKTMLRAREIAEELKLNMKISDVEYQGDGNKAIFYYIADERVDFRQLIKVYASEFRVKIEMKQIGARQEAGRVGGIGPCGRELCCSSSMSNFVSVSTSAARLQDLPLNPQKLAGQCGKLKCCLNFEVDTYVEAQRDIPQRDAVLETRDSTFYHFKTDILSGMMTYSTDKHFAANLVTIPKGRAYEIIRMNRRGNRPDRLAESAEKVEKNVSLDVLEQESITRFDNDGRNDRRKKKKFAKNRDNASSTNYQNKDRVEVSGGQSEGKNAQPNNGGKSLNRVTESKNHTDNEGGQKVGYNNRNNRNFQKNRNKPPRNEKNDTPNPAN